MLPVLDLATLLAAVAMLVLAWEASRQERSAFVALIGISILMAAIAVRFFGGGGLFMRITGFFADVGIAFLLASLVMVLRRARAFPFLAVGILGLGLAAVLLMGGHVVKRGLDALRSEPSSPTSLVVELGPDDHIDEIIALLQVEDLRHERAFPTVSLSTDEDLAQMYIVNGPEASLRTLADALRADRENVDYVEWNRGVSLSPPPSAENTERSRKRFLANDPLVGAQWAIEATHIHEAHRLLARLEPRRKAVVAILDTGVDADHEDLQEVFHASPGRVDHQGHGTHCAGIAGAVANNNLGIASLNWEGRYLEIASFQALPHGGSGTYETIAQAIIDAAQMGADVLSLSLGEYAGSPPRVVQKAVEFAQRRGAIVLASTGNAGQDASGHMPSNIDGVIAVAAVGPDLHRAPFSNTNTSLTRPIAAPGVNILSLKPGGDYVSMSGTSMSTPMVAGLAGILRSLDPDLSASELYDILVTTGTQAEDALQTGRVINAEAAIQAVAQRL